MPRTLCLHLALWLAISLTGCLGRPSESAPAPLPRIQENSSKPAEDHQPLSAATQWLWDQQSEDGGWHSSQYGLLKSGQALTPFVLHTLLQAPVSIAPRPKGAVEKALQFLRDHANEQGALGLADPDILEYPNYSTAYALLCFLEAAPEDPLVPRMAAYLSGQQYLPAGGFPTDHPAYGGWGFGGKQPAGQAGHMDLAHTRRVLQALDKHSSLSGTNTATAAEVFLRLVQRHPSGTRPQPQLDPDHPHSDSAAPYDGGFYFSPVVLAANKGRMETSSEQPYLRSYATATCDGILALLASGVDPLDERVTSASAWLEDHPDILFPAGIPREHPEPWGDAVHFYHLAVRAEACSSLKMNGAWRAQIARLLASRQEADGHFVNHASPLMKEDDPLLATSLAVIALTHANTRH